MQRKMCDNFFIVLNDVFMGLTCTSLMYKTPLLVHVMALARANEYENKLYIIEHLLLTSSHCGMNVITTSITRVTYIIFITFLLLQKYNNGADYNDYDMLSLS